MTSPDEARRARLVEKLALAEHRFDDLHAERAQLELELSLTPRWVFWRRRRIEERLHEIREEMAWMRIAVEAWGIGLDVFA